MYFNINLSDFLNVQIQPAGMRAWQVEACMEEDSINCQDREMLSLLSNPFSTNNLPTIEVKLPIPIWISCYHWTEFRETHSATMVGSGIVKRSID
jgi:hypothetical protein